MPSVKQQTSIKRRQSASVLSDFSNRYHSVEIDYQAPNIIYACFPDHGNTDETVKFETNAKLYEIFENLLRKRGLNINDVDLLIENSNTPLPENTEAKFLAGQKIYVRSRSNMRVVRHSRATHSMDDSPGDRPKRKMSEEAISRKSSFANSKVFQLSKSRQASENKLSGGSEEADTRSNDGSLREINVQDDSASCSASDVQLPPDDGGTRRSRSVAPTRITLGSVIFGSKDRDNMMVRLASYKETSCLNQVPASMELESNWKEIVQDSDHLPPRCVAQQRAIWELVETERNYVQVLCALAELKKITVELGKNLLKDIIVDKVFLNCDILRDIHRESWDGPVLEMLDLSRRTGDPLNAAFLNGWFCNIEKWSHFYSDFIQSHNESLLYLQKKQKEVQLFADFVMWAEQQFPDSIRRLKLSDTLTMPMQRLTRYSLLLKAVLKHSSEHEEQILLQGLIDRVDESTYRLNLEMNNNDLKNRLNEISSQIDGYDCVDQDEFEKYFGGKPRLEICKPMFAPRYGPPSYRRLYYRGELKMKESRQAAKIDVYCFLFTDLFLICKKKTDRKLRTIRPPIHIRDIRFAQLIPEPHTAFTIANWNVFNTCSQLYTMYTTSPEETRRWLECIDNAAKEFGNLLEIDARNAAFAVYDQPHMEDYRMPMYAEMPFYNNNRSSQMDIVHRKSSSMDSQTVAAARSHMDHMHRMVAVSSSSLDKLDHHPDRRAARGVTPRHKLSIVTCAPNPLSCSKSSVDLHMALGAEAGFEGNRNRSRSNSSSGGKSRSPSLRRKLTEPSYHCSTPVRTGSEDSTTNSPTILAPGEHDPTANPMTGRRFEKRYHTADDIDTKHSGKGQSIIKRFSLNVSNAVGGSSRKISARLGENSRRQSHVSQASTAASSESFGSSTSGISSASDGGFTVEVVGKPHISTIAVNESPSDSTLNLDIYEKIMQEESCSGSDSGISQRSPPAPPLPAIPPPLDKPKTTTVENNTAAAAKTTASTSKQTASNPDVGPCKQQEFLKFIFENQLETSEV